MDEKLQQLADEMEACLEKVRSALEELKTDKKWVPKINEQYFFIDSCGKIDSADFDSDIDNWRLSQNDVFRTKEEAKAHLENLKTKAKLRELAEELGAPTEEDWDNEEIGKFYIYCNYDKHEFQLGGAVIIRDIGQIYCLNNNFLDIALERIGADRLKDMMESGV